MDRLNRTHFENDFNRERPFSLLNNKILFCYQKHRSCSMRGLFLKCHDRSDTTAGTHWPNRWMSEAFGETLTRSGTHMFVVFSCVGSFWSRVDAVSSDSACKVWGGGLSGVWAMGFFDWLCASWMAVLIGSMLANQHAVWEGRIPCALCFSMHSVLSFPVFMLCMTRD